MTKELIKCIKLFSLISLLLIFFAPSVQAANTSLVNCAITQIPDGQTATQACLSQAKQESYPLNCNVTGLPQNEACCCSQKTEYSCTWRTEKTVTTCAGPGMCTTSVSGGCNANESPGADCNPLTKPTSSASTMAYCCCPAQATVVATKKADFIIPNLSIKIDTVKLTEDVYCTGANNSGECHIPWIAEYISGVYKYGFGIGGILAAIVLMGGGLMWLVSAGDASKITQAKDLILGSIIGLMILSTSYIILTMVNPELVNMKPLKIGQIERVEVEGDSSKPISLDQAAISSFLGINCGKDSVTDIFNKSKGKITYNQERRGSMSNDDKVYFDCSSYAKFVRNCAGLSDIPAYTGDIFKERVEFKDSNLDSLKPGDLLGWPPDKGEGHVVVYLGDGLFGDAHGGTGRQPGQAIGSSISFKDLKSAASRNGAAALYIVR